MACRILQCYKLSLKSCSSKLSNLNKNKSLLLTQNVRSVSFLSKYSAAALWKSCTSVSNQGKNRGRGKGTKNKIKDLNRGQQIGVGKINMLWPGLSGPVLKGQVVVQQQKLPDNPEREAKILEMRDSNLNRRYRRVHPLERGWTSAKMGGRSLGPPDPVGEDMFENFDTKVLEHKVVTHMTGNLGRKRSFSSFVITGNKNGLCGIALGKSADMRAALRIGKNRAGQKLMFIERYKDHTVLHDFFTQYGSSKITVSKKPEGYGLNCHRAIKCACEVIGIKDLYAKVEGAMNYQNIIKAFLLGLLRQKSLQQLADEKQLHLVEFRKENHYFPQVVASPAYVRKPDEVKTTEIMDFTQYVLNGKVIHQKKKYPPFYTKSWFWQVRCRKQEYLRHQDEVRIRMMAEHGEVRSFLSDKYPEAKPKYWCKKRNEDEAEA